MANNPTGGGTAVAPTQPPESLKGNKSKMEVQDMDKMYIGKFEWKSGSINDNIRKILKGLSIGYYNTFNGDIITSGDNRKVEAEHKENDEYYVYILFA